MAAPAHSRRAAAVVVSAALALAGCGDYGSSGGSAGGDPVTDYCSYGAVSAAQRQGCEDHVTEGDIDALDTNAAKFARGELDKCLSDSGPFCEPR